MQVGRNDNGVLVHAALWELRLGGVMSEKPIRTDTPSDLLALARERHFDALEAAWMECLEPELHDVDELLRVARYLVKRKFTDRAELLLWSLVTAAVEQGDPMRALEVARQAAGVAPDAQALRDELADRYRRACPDVRELDEILQTSGLRKGEAVGKAVGFIEACLRLQPGAFVIHTRSRRVGRVVGFEAGVYVIESEGRTQSLSPTESLARWQPLDSDDFRALVVYDAAQLRALAEDDPARLVWLVVRSYRGQADFKQVKQALIPGVIPADRWSAWWSSAKVPIKRSPLLDVTGTAQPQFVLREAAGGYAEKLRAAFDEAEDPFEKIRHVLDYLAEVAAGHEGSAEIAAGLAVELRRIAVQTSDPTAAIALLVTEAEIHDAFPNAPDPAEELARLVAGTGGSGLPIAGLSEDVTRRVLRAARPACGSRWPQILGATFPAGSLRTCDWIARELLAGGHGDLVLAAAETAAAAPDRHPEAFAWVWRRLFSAGEVFAGRFDRLSATLTFLHLLNRLARTPRHAAHRAEARRSLVRLRSVISANEFRVLRQLIAETDVPAALRLHQAIISNDGIAEHARQELLSDLKERHPEELGKTKDLWEDGHIYVTAEGLARRRAHVEKLVNEDMRRNAKAIGDAAARGDLRENWEYKAALEERDRLVERVTRAREELDLGRVLDPSHISTDKVTIGTAVLLRDVATGQEKTVTFLGPWDADIAQGVYSYLAPLGLRFMGKKVGEHVSASLDAAESEFEILRIETVV